MAAGLIVYLFHLFFFCLFFPLQGVATANQLFIPPSTLIVYLFLSNNIYTHPGKATETKATSESKPLNSTTNRYDIRIYVAQQNLSKILVEGHVFPSDRYVTQARARVSAPNRFMSGDKHTCWISANVPFPFGVFESNTSKYKSTAAVTSGSCTVQYVWWEKRSGSFN